MRSIAKASRTATNFKTDSASSRCRPGRLGAADMPHWHRNELEALFNLVPWLHFGGTCEASHPDRHRKRLESYRSLRPRETDGEDQDLAE